MARAFTGLSVPEEIPRGTRFGHRIVIRETSPKRGRRFLVECEGCGQRDRIQLAKLRQMAKGNLGSYCRKCACKRRRG